MLEFSLAPNLINQLYTGLALNVKGKVPRYVEELPWEQLEDSPDENGALRFYDRLMELLRIHQEVYAAYLQTHFSRHLQPFVDG